jgi:hypothetical protein
MAATSADSGNTLSEMGAIWWLMISQIRPMSGTENRHDATAAIARPPSVRSESVFRRTRGCDMRADAGGE